MLRVVCATLLILAMVFMSPAGGLAQESLSEGEVAKPAAMPLCSLDWDKLFVSLGGWLAIDKPMVTFNEVGKPAHQTQFLAEVGDLGEPSRIAIIIAEWGDASSDELGGVVYCGIISRKDGVLEEVGENPLEERPAAVGKIRL